MIRGILKVLDDEGMEAIHRAALEVLEKTGMQIRGRFLLEALAGAGCRVDFEARRAWFRPETVLRQVEGQRDRYRMVRSSLWYPFCREMPAGDPSLPDRFTVDYGFGAPTHYDALTGQYRTPTARDQVEAIKLGNALEEVGAICTPYICGGVEPRLEVIESARILLLNTGKPGWVGTSCAAEVRHLAEMASLAVDGDREKLRTGPPVFVMAYCTTSPLKLDTRSCEVLEEALKFGFPVNFAPMPILGGTTPMTPAGSAVVATAEILGCLTAATLVNPEVYYYATSIAGEMDMKTTQVCYATPAAILTDAALHQLFRFKYGLVLNVEPAYLEAKAPGIQAAFMKTYRQMAFGCTVSHSLPIGLLDNGAVFSPAQAMLDLDFNRAMYRFHRGLEVTPETIGLETINELGFCERGNYLEHGHTLRHFREIAWDSRFLDRTYRHEKELTAAESDEKALRKADGAWRELVAGQEDFERPAAFRAELDRIVEAARRDLA